MRLSRGLGLATAGVQRGAGAAGREGMGTGTAAVVTVTDVVAGADVAGVVRGGRCGRGRRCEVHGFCESLCQGDTGFGCGRHRH